MSVDHPPFVVNQLRFIRMLREAGIPAAMDQTLDYLRALELIDIGRRDHLYFTARGLLITRAEDLGVFDAVFEEFWGDHRHRIPSVKRRRPQSPLRTPGLPFNITSYDEFRDRQSREPLEIDDKAGTWSDREALMSRRFGDMSAEELEAVRRFLLEASWKISERPTRRFVPDRAGSRLHLRAVVNDAGKHGGVPMKLHYKSRKVKQRPIVALADVSGSMEKYSRLLLLFLHSVTRELKDVETFVFATRLTRLTPQLRLRNIDRALAQSARQVLDWSGGTRIGECLATFNRRWSRQVLHRGSVVLVISDGCDRGEMATLRREIQFIQHRCHRLIWLNPYVEGANYAPLVGGMATALAFVDDFLPIGNLQNLIDLAKHLGSLSPRRSERRQSLGNAI